MKVYYKSSLIRQKKFAKLVKYHAQFEEVRLSCSALEQLHPSWHPMQIVKFLRELHEGVRMYKAMFYYQKEKILKSKK